ncbi:hypothetical protein BC830DRAFT_1153726 [Chytriomyces sp. MP71]|nr:hypothetical protein BC830DRAFT_1153726 [Chytriomyces sp. MP71]
MDCMLPRLLFVWSVFFGLVAADFPAPTNLAYIDWLLTGDASLAGASQSCTESLKNYKSLLVCWNNGNDATIQSCFCAQDSDGLTRAVANDCAGGGLFPWMQATLDLRSRCATQPPQQPSAVPSPDPPKPPQTSSQVQPLPPQQTSVEPQPSTTDNAPKTSERVVAIADSTESSSVVSSTAPATSIIAKSTATATVVASVSANSTSKAVTSTSGAIQARTAGFLLLVTFFFWIITCE